MSLFERTVGPLFLASFLEGEGLPEGPWDGGGGCAPQAVYISEGLEGTLHEIPSCPEASPFFLCFLLFLRSCFSNQNPFKHRI